MNNIDQLAQKIWDYMLMGQELHPADCIIVLGSHDTRVAERGAELFLKKYAPIIIFSGGLGRLTNDTWEKSEAETFADIALEMGVPRKNISIENKSTNTGENIVFTYQLLQEKKLDFKKYILVQKPYMERRTFATFKKQWPQEEAEVMVTSPQINFQDYCNSDFPKEMVIKIMLGDLERIKTYPKLGLQIEQEIPADVWSAYEQLSKTYNTLD